MQSKSLITIVSVAGLLGATSAQALPIIEEQFDGTGYTVGANLAGLSGGTGFSSAWAMDTGMTASVVAGLSLGNLEVSGNAGRFFRQNVVGYNFGSRTVSVGISSGDIWMSHLFQWNTDFGGDGHGTGLGIAPSASGTDSRFVQEDLYFNSNPERVGIGYEDGAGPGHSTAFHGVQAGSGNIALNTTYFAVARWTAVDGTTGNAKVWVFDSAAAVNAILGTNDESVLDANAYSSISYSGTVTVAAFASGDVLRYGGRIGGNGGRTDMTIDEIRIGTSAADVTPAIPEPASLALMGLGGLMILGRRRA